MLTGKGYLVKALEIKLFKTIFIIDEFSKNYGKFILFLLYF